MKFLMLGLLTVFSAQSFANGGDLSSIERARGTAAIDENDLDELPDPKTKIDRQKVLQNPRNPAFVDGFNGVENEETQEEEIIPEPENILEGEAYGTESDEPVWH